MLINLISIKTYSNECVELITDKGSVQINLPKGSISFEMNENNINQCFSKLNKHPGSVVIAN